MIINFSNHHSSKWSEFQIQEAQKFGTIIDLNFPLIDPNSSEKDICILSDQYVKKITELSNGEPCTIHIMGEMTLTFTIITRLKQLNYKCIASTTKREVNWIDPNVKKAHFSFIRFREYK